MNVHRSSRIVPIVAAISVVLGIVIGTFLANRFSGNQLNIINTSTNKLSDLLHIIDDQYVDTVDIAKVVEDGIPKILEELDPHSTYISAKDAKTANDDLRGSFSGVGIQFTIREDTVRVTNIIKSGPAEKVGLMAGDRIVSVDDKPYVGKVVTNEETLHRLKGDKGTKVKIGVVRHGHKKPLTFIVTRDDIPVKSVDATYMLTDKLGYIKIKSFGETTYPELLSSLADLQQQGFSGLVVDLRENGGGYLSSAIQTLNEFLPKNRLIVYTEGRKWRREEYKSDGRGSYQDIPIIVLTNEYTASAAEIFSGAIQDNDRGVIIGRRSYGKGLVQQQIDFSDGSLIRLTIARYYTPSGRCIQKPYTAGETREEYEMDILTRYNHGEFFNEDSIRQTGQVYKTSIGREVYGGGGIMPDYFVGEDTTKLTPYYREAVSKGLIQQFCFEYVDNNRNALKSLTTPVAMVKYLRKQNLVGKFADYADKHDLPRRNNMIISSQRLFENAIYGAIIYYMLDMNDYMRFVNQDDATIKKAIEIFNQGKTRPQLGDKKSKSKTAYESRHTSIHSLAKGRIYA